MSNLDPTGKRIQEMIAVAVGADLTANQFAKSEKAETKSARDQGDEQGQARADLGE